MQNRSTKAFQGGHATTLFEFLRQDSATGGLLPAAERLVQLQQDLNPLLPVGSEKACEIHLDGEGTLVIRASSAALAGKLRQMAPSIQAGLNHRGWKVSAIQLRVQPLNNSNKSMAYNEVEAAPKHARMSSEALQNWQELASQLDESPLQQAVARLLRHHQR